MRLSRPFSLFVSGAAALAAAPLWAQNVEEKAAKAGMPQLDMQFYPGQIFWLIISFTILYVLMRRFALPGVERTQQKRHAAIQAELAAAAAANDAARAIIVEYEKTLANARIEAQAAVTEITRKSADVSLQRQTEQQHVLNQRLREAEARITVARDTALRDAQAGVADIASAALDKITGLKLQVKA